MGSYILLSAILALMLNAVVQEPSDEHSGAMKKLKFLVGLWEGKGWIQFGQSTRRPTYMTETVESKIDGLVLVIDGIGKDDNGRIVHHAFGILSYDPTTKRYLLRVFKANGHFVDANAYFDGDHFRWEFDEQQVGTIRYSIRLNESGQWTEVGEVKRNRAKWVKFFEMILDRRQALSDKTK